MPGTDRPRGSGRGGGAGRCRSHRCQRCATDRGRHSSRYGLACAAPKLLLRLLHKSSRSSSSRTMYAHWCPRMQRLLQRITRSSAYNGVSCPGAESATQQQQQLPGDLGGAANQGVQQPQREGQGSAVAGLLAGTAAEAVDLQGACACWAQARGSCTLWRTLELRIASSHTAEQRQGGRRWLSREY